MVNASSRQYPKAIAIITLVVAGLMFYCAVLLATAALRRFSALSPNVGAAVVTALAAMGTVAYTQRENKRKDITEAHRTRKADVYRRFMDLTSQILTAKKAPDGSPIFPEDLQERFVLLTSELIVWASPDVLSKFDAWRVAANLTTGELLLAADDLMQAFRKDLGNSNRGLKRGDVLKLYLKDPREISQAVRPPTSA